PYGEVGKPSARGAPMSAAVGTLEHAAPEGPRVEGGGGGRIDRESLQKVVWNAEKGAPGVARFTLLGGVENAIPAEGAVTATRLRDRGRTRRITRLPGAVRARRTREAVPAAGAPAVRIAAVPAHRVAVVALLEPLRHTVAALEHHPGEEMRGPCIREAIALHGRGTGHEARSEDRQRFAKLAARHAFRSVDGEKQAPKEGAVRVPLEHVDGPRRGSRRRADDDVGPDSGQR